MSFALKILFAAFIFTIVGLTTIIAIYDVSIPQETVVKIIAQDRYLDE